VKMSGYEKVLLVGMDGLDPKVAGRLMDEGKLPNFKRLSEDGSFLNLSTSFPPHSPVAWTSIATGVNPAKHGIFDFIKRDPKSYMPELSLFKSSGGISGTKYTSSVCAKQFWKKTSESGIPTTVIRFPVSFPPEKVNGNLLCGLGVPDIKGMLSSYRFYTEEDVSDKKVLNVSFSDGVCDTVISGPKTRKGEYVVDVTTPLKIEISDDDATLSVSGKTYVVREGEFSEFIRVKFKLGAFKSTYGICRAFLISTQPFRLYLTTVQIDPENPWVPISHPADYAKNLAGEIGLFYTLGIPEETDPLVDGRINEKLFLSQCAQIEKQREKMFWFGFERFKKGVYAFVFDTSDRIQHVFWRNKLLEGREFNVSPEIEDYWVKKDDFLGRLLDKTTKDTLFLIASDHGFTSFERAVSLNTWLVEEGFMKLTCELDGDGGGFFEFVDWSRTQAYSLGFNSIYVNAKGREGQGIVEDRESVAADVAKKLELLRDDKFGGDPVNKAYVRESIYGGDFLSEAPDVIVGFNPGYRSSWQTAVGGFTKDAVSDNERIWDGDHLIDPAFVPGVLFSNTNLGKDSASQLDVAPTILSALGLSENGLDGKSLL